MESRSKAFSMALRCFAIWPVAGGATTTQLLRERGPNLWYGCQLTPLERNIFARARLSVGPTLFSGIPTVELICW